MDNLYEGKQVSKPAVKACSCGSWAGHTIGAFFLGLLHSAVFVVGLYWVVSM